MFNNKVTTKQRIAIRRVLLRLKGFNYDRSKSGKQISVIHKGVKYTVYPCANRVITKGRGVLTIEQFFKEIYSDRTNP